MKKPKLHRIIQYLLVLLNNKTTLQIRIVRTNEETGGTINNLNARQRDAETEFDIFIFDGEVRIAEGNLQSYAEEKPVNETAKNNKNLLSSKLENGKVSAKKF